MTPLEWYAMTALAFVVVCVLPVLSFIGVAYVIGLSIEATLVPALRQIVRDMVRRD